jgi:signal transduction histidine kinase
MPSSPTCSTSLSSTEGLSVWVDPVRFDQVLTNLLTNAYRYGGRQVAISGARTEPGVVLAVADNGEGVPPDLMSRLFEPFARGSNAESHGGSGIGLALCRRLVEAFGGELQYEPADPGARFTIRLPVS